MNQKYDKPVMPDERTVKNAQTGAAYLVDSGRAELARGYSPRGTARETLVAFANIEEASHKHGRELAERGCNQWLAGGARIVADDLSETVSRSDADARLDADATPADILVMRAAKWVTVRRRAIARLCKGERNRAMRHSFGISRPLTSTSAVDVQESIVALLAGRKEHEGTPAARLITDADVKSARDYEARLQGLLTKQEANKSAMAETARMRDVQHVALELFYDRFAAAVDLAFEADDDTRVALLSLVPRRKERRVAKAEGQPAQPPVPAPVQKAGNTG